uniref:Gibberellin receptor GID1-like protein n=1 Tax=Physcomitrium patens TaxID=3218 RepID=A9LY14_PHYPA|nr:gibberellin receptor GID1-like protein [Physcomitrium patens]
MLYDLQMASMMQLRLLCKVVVKANDLARRKDGTINRWLADVCERKVPANPKPIKGVHTVDVTIDPEAGVWVRLFIPTEETVETPSKSASNDTQIESNKTMPIVYYYHGGGFTILCPDFYLYDVFCRRLAKCCKSVVISLHYRRAPEFKFPTAYDDSFKGLEWLQSEKATASLPLNVDFSRVFLCGDSAGANIAYHMALQSARKDLGRVSLKGVVIIQGFFGGEERTPAELRLKNVPLVSVESLDWYWKSYLPKGSNRDHPACNIFGPNSSDLSDVSLPPFLNIVGGLDILQDWEMRFAEGLQKAGKQVQTIFYEEGIHTFALLNQAKVGPKMFLDVAAFINSH